MSQPNPNQPAPITLEQVRHVAKLSRLSLNDQQLQKFAQQLSDVLTHVSKLNELDVSGVEPMAHAMDVVNVMRDDQPVPGLPVEKVLANAPGQSPPFFKVPKVLGEGSGA